MFTKDEMAQMTAAELDTARTMNAAEEAGEDVFGDGDAGQNEGAAEEEAAAAATLDEEGDPAAAATLQGGEETPDAGAATVEDLAAAATLDPAPEPAQYQVADTSAIAEQRKTLRAEKAAIESEWAAGTLTDEARAEKMAGIEDKLDALLIEQTRAETLREANEQHRQQKQAEMLGQLAAKAKATDGVDYFGDADMGKLYDAKLGTVLKDEAFKTKPFAEQAAEAHARVLKAIGKTAAPATQAPPAAADATPAAPVVRAKPPAPPPTLRELPAADKANAGDDLEGQWEAATGAKAEALWQRMSPAQQERLLSR